MELINGTFLKSPCNFFYYSYKIHHGNLSCYCNYWFVKFQLFPLYEQLLSKKVSLVIVMWLLV